MNEDVARVVAAAREFLAQADVIGRLEAPLAEAVEALDARDAATRSGVARMEKQDRTWGEVVVGDEVYSGKTGKYYPVVSTKTNERTKTVQVMIQGSSKPIVRPVGEPTKIQRGVLGEGVDMFAILWSR